MKTRNKRRNDKLVGAWSPAQMVALSVITILSSTYLRGAEGFFLADLKTAALRRRTSPDKILMKIPSQPLFGSDDGYDGLGEYDPSEDIRPEREVVVGDPQIRLKQKDQSVTSILRELAAIQQQGPQKYCILGTRHCSFLHQQIIELLYVLYTSVVKPPIDPLLGSRSPSAFATRCMN